MPEKKDIFISYSHLDAEIATELTSRLQDAGLSCFVAERDISASQQWEPRIREEIKSVKCVLILLTPRSKESTWVAIEAGAAWVLETDIIPATMFVDAKDLVEPIKKYQVKPVETNAQTTTLIQELRDKLRPETESATPTSVTNGKSPSQENFNNRRDWERLQKIGTWGFDEHSSIFQGEGKNQYLLSHLKYGERPFKIKAHIQFSNLHPINEIAAVNAGIVFGWRSNNDIRRYFNLTFSGSEIRLALIGSNGGSVTRDVKRIGGGIPFQLKPLRYYTFDIEIKENILTLAIDDQQLFNITFEGDPKGRIGLRPWRSKVEADKFVVQEL